MDTVSAGRRQILATVLALVLMVASGMPWTALADDGTPTDQAPDAVSTSEPSPEVAPTEIVTLQQEPSSDDDPVPDDISPEPTTSVVGISIACDTQGATLTGQVTTSDPASASTLNLLLSTTDDPAIPALESIAVGVSPGQTSYPFVATLESGDFAASTTAKVRVTSADGLVLSEAMDIAFESGATVCVPPGSTNPTATATVTETVPATTTATTTATATPPVATTGTVINTAGGNLRCRAQANTSATVLANLAPGSTVAVRGSAVNGWVPVVCAGQNGWVSGSYLRVNTAPVSTQTPTPTVTATPGAPSVATIRNTGGSNLRCRTAPNTTATVITLLPEGSRVDVRGATSNGWVPVTCGGQAGFVSAAYTSISAVSTTPTPTSTAPTGSPTATTTATATTTPGGGTTAYVTGTGGSGLRCRTSAPSGTVIVVLPENAQVTVLSQANGWAQVSCGGQTGWISLSYVLFAVNPGTGAGALRIDINLSTQYMIVYQGNNVLSRTYVSTGRRGFDTPPGTFYINRKVKLKDMAGVLGGEAYHVKDVPDVMYFTNRGHAIHGAYWHNNFGYVMSHGCVNLPLGFATWLYNITPIGTKVTIHY